LKGNQRKEKKKRKEKARSPFASLMMRGCEGGGGRAVVELKRTPTTVPRKKKKNGSDCIIPYHSRPQKKRGERKWNGLTKIFTKGGEEKREVGRDIFNCVFPVFGGKKKKKKVQSGGRREMGHPHVSVDSRDWKSDNRKTRKGEKKEAGSASPLPAYPEGGEEKGGGGKTQKDNPVAVGKGRRRGGKRMQISKNFSSI